MTDGAVIGEDGVPRCPWAAAPGTMRDFLLDLNPESKRTVDAQLEPALRHAKAGESFQFERHGYFVKDPKDGAFNRTVTLRDSWTKS